jgi:RNA polymerase sigma-70 factor (ECF subfamily)
MIIDERRSARFRNESVTPDLERTNDRAGPVEVDAALDRLLLSGALAQLSSEHRAVIRRSYYQGWTNAQIAADLGIAEGTVKSRLHYAIRALRLALQELGFSGTQPPQRLRSFHPSPVPSPPSHQGPCRADTEPILDFTA